MTTKEIKIIKKEDLNEEFDKRMRNMFIKGYFDFKNRNKIRDEGVY